MGKAERLMGVQRHFHSVVSSNTLRASLIGAKTHFLNERLQVEGIQNQLIV